MNDKEIITLALYIASIRYENPDLAFELETILYKSINSNYSETTIHYILELTETRVYH